MSADPANRDDLQVIKTIRFDELSVHKLHQFTSLVYSIVSRYQWVGNTAYGEDNSLLDFKEYADKCVSTPKCEVVSERQKIKIYEEILAEENLLSFVNDSMGLNDIFVWLPKLNKRSFDSVEKDRIYFGLTYDDEYYYVAFRLKSDKDNECKDLRDKNIYDASYHHKSCCFPQPVKKEKKNKN